MGANVNSNKLRERYTNMALKDILKVNRKTFFNPSAWIGVNELKTSTTIIWGIVKDLITPAKPERVETFEEAMHRLHLTEKDLRKQGQIYFLYALLFVGLAVSSLVIGFYFLFHHKTIAGWLLTICVSALFGVQAFRFHFWYFQIKHRKLGCTFEEWISGKTNKNGEK